MGMRSTENKHGVEIAKASKQGLWIFIPRRQSSEREHKDLLRGFANPSMGRMVLDNTYSRLISR